MNSQDIQNLQESYLAVYDDETRENLEFENWVNNLLDEGYDLSSYTWDEMAEIYIDEAREPGVPEYKPNRLNPLPEPPPLSGERGDGSGYGDPNKFTQDTDAKSFKPGVTVPRVKKFGRISRFIPHGIGDHANKTQSRVSTIVRKDPGAPTSQKLPPPDKKKPSKKIVRRGNQNEAYDLYDVILSHLLDEGYAETQEAAEAIMVNMSEEWRESICEELLNEISDKKVVKFIKQRERRFNRSVDSGAPNKEFYQLRRAHQAAAKRNERTGSNVKVDPDLAN